jgi:spermidine/putrescine transport system substrate-binding protein
MPKGQSLQYVVCKESALFNADNAVIPAAAKHPGTATLFIDWLLQPANMAQVVEYTGYLVPTTAGVTAYDAMVKDYPWLKAQTGLMGDSEQWMAGLDQASLSAWNQVWTEVKAA